MRRSLHESGVIMLSVLKVHLMNCTLGRWRLVEKPSMHKEISSYHRFVTTDVSHCNSNIDMLCLLTELIYYQLNLYINYDAYMITVYFLSILSTFCSPCPCCMRPPPPSTLQLLYCTIGLFHSGMRKIRIHFDVFNIWINGSFLLHAPTGYYYVYIFFIYVISSARARACETERERERECNTSPLYYSDWFAIAGI